MQRSRAFLQAPSLDVGQINQEPLIASQPKPRKRIINRRVGLHHEAVVPKRQHDAQTHLRMLDIVEIEHDTYRRARYNRAADTAPRPPANPLMGQELLVSECAERGSGMMQRDQQLPSALRGDLHKRERSGSALAIDSAEAATDRHAMRAFSAAASGI